MRFHFLFAFYYFTFVAIRIIYHRKARHTRVEVVDQESRLNMAIRVLLGLGYIGALTTYIFYPPLLRIGEFSLPLWTRWTGVGITGFSLAFIWWVHWALGIQSDTSLHTQADHKLISHGSYRWVRHPMYSSLFLMGLSWLLLTSNWFVGAPLMVSINSLMIIRVPNEEKILIDLFGNEYINYVQFTGRYLPRLKRR